jgi:excisionase family DNA binding protein
MASVEATLSPKQLAEVIGVSESSLKRWADQGKLQAVRTAGGHRRIPVTEAIRFARAGRMPILKPAALGLPELQAGRAGDSTDADRLGELLFEHLQRGEAEPVRGTILELYLAGRSIAWICDGPLRQAMARIGELYHHDPRGIHLEHRATDICLRTLHLLRSVIGPGAGPAAAPVSGDGLEAGHSDVAGEDGEPRQSDEPAPLAIGAAVSGDPYQMPSLMAACTLQELGFEAVNLGPDLPIASLLSAAEDYHPRLVWLACSVPGVAPAASAAIDLAERLAAQHAALALGGRGFDAMAGLAHPNLHHCGTMRELAAFARGLAATV